MTKSNCCNAATTVRGNTTHYYTCNECGKACDISLETLMTNYIKLPRKRFGIPAYFFVLFGAPIISSNDFFFKSPSVYGYLATLGFLYLTIPVAWVFTFGGIDDRENRQLIVILMILIPIMLLYPFFL